MALKAIISTAMIGFSLAATPGFAGVVDGDSSDPVAELNALYQQICRWTEGETIPVQIVHVTHDGVDDFLFTYDVACRGYADTFSRTAGTARQIWVSVKDGTYRRVLDANAHALRFESREGREFIILQHQGSYCMTADAAPCFLTLEFTENQLIWADDQYQHPSMKARLQHRKNTQEETSND